MSQVKGKKAIFEEDFACEQGCWLKNAQTKHRQTLFSTFPNEELKSPPSAFRYFAMGAVAGLFLAPAGWVFCWLFFSFAAH